MLPALWPIQRAQPRPCTYPYALVDPPKRLTSPMPFICNKFDLTPVQSQVRTNKHICTQPHPQAHTQTCTPTRHANTRMHKRERTEKHADAQTQHTRHTRPHTCARTRTTQRGDTTNANAHTQACTQTRHALKHTGTTFKIGLKHHHRHHTQTRTDTPMRGGGGVVPLARCTWSCLCVCVCVCVCVSFAFTLLCHTHTKTRPHEKNTFSWGLALGTLLLQGVSAGRPVAGKIPANRKPAGALFWHLNWSDRPKVYIKGRVRPEKKNTPIKAVRCRLDHRILDLGWTLNRSPPTGHSPRPMSPTL